MSVSDTSLSPGWHVAAGFVRDERLESDGIPHGVTARGLGNMKDSQRRGRAFALAGLDARQPLLLHQVHGTEIHEGNRSVSSPVLQKGDGWITTDPTVVPSVFVADCLPIFVWDRRDRSAVGVFHAGWRGLAAGMGRAAVRAFRRYGLTPEKLAASVGPHIGACCYVVGPDVARSFHPEAVKQNNDSLHLDLGEEARLQLAESGITAEMISVSISCTSCMNDNFFSYRREKMDLRMMAFIGLPSNAH